MKQFRELYNEASLSRVYSHTQKRNIAIVSAERDQYTKAENAKRTNELKADIRRNGFGFLTIKGIYQGTVEMSFMIIGPEDKDKNRTKQFAVALGKKYSQDSVLVKQPDNDNAYVVGTNTTGSLGMGREASLGKWHPNRSGEYLSALGNKKSKTFVFESIKFEYQNREYANRERDMVEF